MFGFGGEGFRVQASRIESFLCRLAMQVLPSEPDRP